MRILLIVALCFGALSVRAESFTHFYVQQTGDNLNAGSTTNDTAVFTYASGNWEDGTGVFTVASGNPSSDGVAVGDWASVYTNGNTRTHYVGLVTARDTTTITVSLTAGGVAIPTDGTGNRTLKIGGAWRGPNGTDLFPWGLASVTFTNISGSNDCRVNIKAGATNYFVTSGNTNSLAGPIWFWGYTNTPGDGGRATISGWTNQLPYVFLSLSGIRQSFVDMNFDVNGWTNDTFSGGPYMMNLTGADPSLYRVRFSRSWRSSLRVSGAGGVFVECEAERHNYDGANGFAGFEVTEEGTWIRCWAHHAADNSSDSAGWVVTADVGEPIIFIDCISSHNAGDGWANTEGGTHMIMINCAAVSNTSSGLIFTSASATHGISHSYIENCIFSNNGEWGIDIVSTRWAGPVLVNNAFYNNTDGQINRGVPSLRIGTITLTGDPFTSANTGNFALNNTAGAGAALRALGRSYFLQNTNWSATTTSYLDVGPVQHQDSGGASPVTTGSTYAQ